MTAHREVDMYMHQLACKHTPTHTQPRTLHSVMVNALIIESSFFGLLFNGLCLLFIFKSRNDCSHFHIKIPPLRNMLLCGQLVALLISECAHPHKRKSIHKHTTMSRPARTHTHTHTIIPLSHARITSYWSQQPAHQTGSRFHPWHTLRSTP